MYNIAFYTTLSLFIFVCTILILLVLIQKGRGGGLSSAFGGAGGNTAFGSKTGDVLTWATSIIFGVFLLLAIGLNLLTTPRTTAATTPTGTAPLPTPITPPPATQFSETPTQTAPPAGPASGALTPTVNAIGTPTTVPSTLP